MSPFELLKQRLLQLDATMYSMREIERAMEGLPIEVIRRVGPETPMGRLQRNILTKLVAGGRWDPDDHKRHPTLLPPYLSAAKGLVARGFATIRDGVYYPTHNGKQEALRKHLVGKDWELHPKKETPGTLVKGSENQT